MARISKKQSQLVVLHEFPLVPQSLIGRSCESMGASKKPSTLRLVVASIVFCAAHWHIITIIQPTTAYEPISPNKAQFHVAPMQGYTNAQTRKMFNLLSPSSTKWTEMEKLDDIFPKGKTPDYLWDALEKRLGSPEFDLDSDPNLVLQLGTNDPTRLQSCVSHTFQRYDNTIREINLNCGCPAIESGGASTYGASLMKDARLTGELVRSVRNGLEGVSDSNLPSVSVKCRIGVFETDQDMRPMTDDDYKYLRNYISTIQQNGADHVILHARPAVLSGLSPVKNRIVPTLDYEFVERIASDFEGEVNVTLNGGITTLEQLRSFLNKSHSDNETYSISSYMAGRWCLRRPLDLIHIEELLANKGLDSLSGNPNKPSALSLIQTAIEEYIDDAIHMSGASSSARQDPTIADLCLPLFLMVEQLKDDYDYEIDDEANHYGQVGARQAPLLTYEDMETLHDVLDDGIAQIEDLYGNGKKKKKQKPNGSINFKRLSSFFKPLVGTKVANKWKRNRAEL